MAEGNNCLICLESLFSENCSNLGVTKTCGHPFHVTCFREWEASKVGSNGGGAWYDDDRAKVACPYCNTKTDGFTKIYLNLPTMDDLMDDSDNDDDDSSVGSIPTTEKEEALEEDKDEENQQGSGGEKNEDGLSDLIGMLDSTTSDTNEDLGNDGDDDDDQTTVAEERQATENSDDIVDLTDSPAGKEKPPKEKKRTKPLKPSSSKAKTDSTDSNSGEDPPNDDAMATATLKRKVKVYKKRFKQAKSRLQEVSQKQSQILSQHNEMKEKVKAAEGVARQAKSSQERQELDLNHLRLTNTKLERKLQEAEQKVKKSEEKITSLSEELDSTEARYNRKVEQLRKNITVENQQILSKYPEVVEENKNLKETIERKTKYWANLKKELQKIEPEYRRRIESSVGSDPDSNNPKLNARQIKQGLRMAQEMTEANTKRRREQEESEQETKAKKKKQTAANPHAARIMKAQAATNNSKKPTKNAGDLDHIFSKLDKQKPARASAKGSENNINTPKQHSSNNSSFSARLPLGILTKPKRKPTQTHRTAFKKSKGNGGNGDIRSFL